AKNRCRSPCLRLPLSQLGLGDRAREPAIADHRRHHEYAKSCQRNRIGGDDKSGMRCGEVHHFIAISAMRSWRSLRHAISLRMATRWRAAKRKIYPTAI